MFACYKGHKDVVRLLLHHPDQNIELNARNLNGSTAFMWACGLKLFDVVILLLEYSEVVDINIPESFPISKKIKNLIKRHSIKVRK